MDGALRLRAFHPGLPKADASPVASEPGIHQSLASVMRQRPLSPHLQVYRLPITALLSISHRITGVVLTIGTLIGIVFLAALATNPPVFDALRDGLAMPLGRAALWLWIYAFLFHLCHGVRHLLWDVGWGFEAERMNHYAVIELLASVVLLIGVFVSSQFLL